MSRQSLGEMLQRRLLFVGLVAAGLLTPTLASAQSDLDEAYQKEFAHLEAQKRALKKRLKILENDRKQAVEEAERKRDHLQGELTALRQTRDDLKRQLRKLDERSKSNGQGPEILERTFKQASSTLADYPMEFQPPEEPGQYKGALPTLFVRGTDAIERSRSIRVGSGEFFLPDGTKTDGEIVRIGHVAAYGLSEDHAGALAPAGKGRLKLWDEPTADTARAVADGESPGTLETFLFESLDEEVDQKAEETWYQTVQNGGIVAWVIVGLGLLGVLMVLARAVTLAWTGSNARRVVREVTGQVADGQSSDALEYCEEASGAASRILSTALDNITRDRGEIEDLVSEAMMREAPRIERFGSAILVLAAVAPLLGLLGTVTGMIATFDIITEFGTGDPRMLSGGISEALITTQFGLAVAIPLLLVGNLLKGWAERIQSRLERGALRVVNLVELGTAESAEPEAAPSDVPTPESDGGDRDANSEALGAI